MKVKVIKQFMDKSSNLKLRNIGEVLEVTVERYEELITSKLGVFVEKEMIDTEKEEIIEEHRDVEDEDSEEDIREKIKGLNLEEMTKKELAELGIDLDMKMTKEEMLEELRK